MDDVLDITYKLKINEKKKEGKKEKALMMFINMALDANLAEKRSDFM